MKITGVIPQIVASDFPELKENVIIKGNDIDITISDGGKETYLYAIRTGRDYDIVDLDDNLNILPEYDEGDIIGLDVVKKLFMQSIMSSLIVSFSPLGKIRDAAENVVNKGKNAYKKGKNKLNKAVKWLIDEIDEEDAQNWIRRYDKYSRAKVGRVEMISDKLGGTFAALVGNPADKTYSVWIIYRNGNTFKTKTVYSPLSSSEALNTFNTITGDKLEDDSTTKDKGEWKQGEGFQVKDSDVNQSIKKKKKKSKYNGCNVTGCEDGNLTGAGSLVACGRIFSTLEEFAKYISGKEFTDEVSAVLKKFISTLSKINLKTRKDITVQSKDTLALDFSKTNLTSENYNITIQFTKDRILVWSNDLAGLSNEQKLDNTLITLDSIIKKQGSQQVQKPTQ